MESNNEKTSEMVDRSTDRAQKVILVNVDFGFIEFIKISSAQTRQFFNRQSQNSHSLEEEQDNLQSSKKISSPMHQ